MGIVVTFLPLLVAVRLRYPSEPAKYEKAVNFCERYAFRVYRLNQRRADAGRSSLNWLAHELYHDKMDFEDAIKQMYDTLLYYCDDAKCRECLEEVAD